MKPSIAAFVVALLVGALVAVPGQTGFAEPSGDDDVGEQARRLLEDGGFQVALPLQPQPSEPAIPAGVGQFLLWGSLALALIVGAVLLARELGLGDRGALGARASTAEPALLDPTRALADPDRLAGEGRYDEAVHMLLLVAIRRLSAETSIEPRPSSTARELIATFPLERKRRGSFATLVRVVEWSLFGGRPVSAGDYDRSRETFRELVGP